MASAPFCNVEIAKPAGKPQSPVGIRPIPPGTKPDAAWTIINNNFNQLLKGNFTENRALRQTTITRVYDPRDTSIFLTVRQVTGVVWSNSLTGQTISWNRGDQPNPPAQTS